MSKEELIELVKQLPEDLPAEVWERLADVAQRYLTSGAGVSEWSQGESREEEGAETDRWLEERR